jgi:hypothetical protein
MEQDFLRSRRYHPPIRRGGKSSIRPPAAMVPPDRLLIRSENPIIFRREMNLIAVSGDIS